MIIPRVTPRGVYKELSHGESSVGCGIRLVKVNSSAELSTIAGLLLHCGVFFYTTTAARDSSATHCDNVILLRGIGRLVAAALV